MEGRGRKDLRVLQDANKENSYLIRLSGETQKAVFFLGIFNSVTAIHQEHLVSSCFSDG